MFYVCALAFGVCVGCLCLVFMFRFVISLLVCEDWIQQCKSLLVFIKLFSMMIKSRVSLKTFCFSNNQMEEKNKYLHT